jgi:hypothetical protein
MMQTALPDTEVCELLPWDSSFFGVKIGRVAPRRLSADTMAQVLEWRRSQQVRCLYLQADPDDGETIHLAEAAGFHLVDVRVTLERRVKAAGSAAATADGIRLYRPEDLQRLKAIARASHADSRFFFDRHYSRRGSNGAAAAGHRRFSWPRWTGRRRDIRRATWTRTARGRSGWWGWPRRRRGAGWEGN